MNARIIKIWQDLQSSYYFIPVLIGLGIRHKLTILVLRRLLGQKGRDNVDARREQIQEVCIIGKAGHDVIVIHGADRNGGRDAGRFTDLVGEPVIAGGDDRRHACSGELLHEDFIVGAKAWLRKAIAAQAHVHGRQIIAIAVVQEPFQRGDLVELRDGSGRVHGRGLVNYGANACRTIAGHHSSEIDALLGWRGYDEIITRDNLAMTSC